MSDSNFETSKQPLGGWDRYEMKVLSDIKEAKDEIKEVKDEVYELKLAFTEMKMEVKQIVNKSAATTGFWVSFFVSIASGIAVYLITGERG